MQAKAALSQDGASADAKVLAAIAAPIRHRLVIFALMDIEATTVTASWFIAPAVALKIQTSGFLVREPFEELVEADGFGLFLAHET